jgi:hypothetical protein
LEVEPVTDELPEHRVPITVFCSVRAVDYADARSVAEMAVRHTLTGRKAGAIPGPLPTDIHLHLRGEDIPVAVHHVMETAVAARNGYLWTEATSQAYRKDN